jgi:hypothetical protein
MKIEEKIARAYHKDLSWRKVLVQLEPDAHNNMIVRRMFANAYGWPVVKHMCDTHFAFTAAAQTRDDEEATVDRAEAANKGIPGEGEEVLGQTELPEGQVEHELAEPDRSRSADDIAIAASPPGDFEGAHEVLKKTASRKLREQHGPRDHRTASEIRESRDDVSELVSKINAAAESSNSYSSMSSGRAALSRLARQDSARWSDRFFDGSDSELEDDDPVLAEELRKAQHRAESSHRHRTYESSGTAQIANVLTESPLPTRLNTKEKLGKLSTDQTLPKVTDESTPLTAEPAELEPLTDTSDTGTPQATDNLGPGSITNMSPTTTGLRLALGEHLGDISGHDTGHHERRGIAKEVAKASSKASDGTEKAQI